MSVAHYNLNYRPEIDGLRALAILPVILFHAGFQTFSGGFVGVDVFFVISGYLITTIILAELEQGKFSIVNFYERRARRILPALFLVMLVCLPFAWFWLLPSDMKEFSKSLVAVSIFASNILFKQESGYFDTAAELKPLLHTWSLALEEQYYLLFPLFLMLLWRLGRRWVLMILGLTLIVSLGYAQYKVYVKPASAFYLLPSRGWELLIGAFVAFYLSKANRVEFGKSLSEVCGWLGIALIIFSIFAYSKETRFPGLYALVPTLGAAMIILFAKQQTTVGKFVGNKAFVGVGLISYSAYLWHQPLFAFARHRSLTEPSLNIFVALSVLSLFLAYFSWRFVETPFRARQRFSQTHIFIYALIGMIVFIGIGSYGNLSNGVFLNQKRSAEFAQLDFRFRANRGLSDKCNDDNNDSLSCMTGDSPEVLVWGDSFAMHLVQGLIASKPDIKLVQKTMSMCGPFFDIAPISAKYERAAPENCISRNDQVFDFLKRNPNIKYVVMSSPFSQYVGQNVMVLTKDGDVVSGNKIALSSMIETIRRIKELGKIPIIFSPPPVNGEDIGRCLKKATFFVKDNANCNIDYLDTLKHQGDVWSFLKKIEKTASVVWLTDFLCADNLCKASFAGEFIYRDTGHLSHEGSAYLGKNMDFYGRLKTAGMEAGLY